MLQRAREAFREAFTGEKRKASQAHLGQLAASKRQLGVA